MLVIRSEQMDSLRKAALSGFETEMLMHLRNFSPPLYESAGEEQMRKVVGFGRERARNYGFTFRGSVRLYLELMLLFGSRFDTDPQYPWAAEILNNRSAALQMRRADALYERVLDYRRKVNGPKDAFALSAYRKMLALAKEPIAIDLRDPTPGLLWEIKRIYPQKALYVGDEALSSLILEGIGAAEKHHVSTVRGITMIVLFMLALGHGCADDPLYPWISRLLKKDVSTDLEARAHHLERKGLTWLEHVLIYFEREADS